MQAAAFWWTGPLQGEIRPADLPLPGPDDVLVRTRLSGVSRGTERIVATGAVPAAERQRMRAPYQDGDFPFPVKYGYAAVGRVEQGLEGLAGRDVLALHPHQTAFVLPAADVLALPPGLPPARAVLGPNMETALNALWDAGAGPGLRIVVLGAGVVGCLVAWLAARLAGSEVTLVDIDPGRATVAARLGLGFCGPGEAPREADLVVEASGSAAGLERALELAGLEATVLVLAWYADQAPAVPLGRAFHSRRLRLISSQVGAVAPAQRPRWTHRRRLAKALELLRDPALDALIDSECAFADLPERLPSILAGTGLCHRITYPNDEAELRCTP